MRVDYVYTCGICTNTIPAMQWHDCKGIHDEERFLAGKMPRSARKRLAKKYGVLNTWLELRQAIESERR